MNSPGSIGRRLRLVPLAAGVAAMACGLAAGLARIGIELPLHDALPALHGALMVSGFLGTVISLERAVALGQTGAVWPYAAPVAAGTGALLLLAGQTQAAALALIGGSAVLAAGSLMLMVRLPALFTALLAVAALCWVAGNAAFALGQPIPYATGWWLAFLVLTIAAERIELSRLLQPSQTGHLTILAATAAIIAGAARGEWTADAAPLTGLGLIVLTIWLVRHDLATRTIRQHGRTRFSAASILTGYCWLAAAGLLLLVAPAGTAAFSYDAAVHSLAVGFVLSMIFGHAPIILPAVTGWRVGFSPASYGPLALLHLSIAIRVVADIDGFVAARQLSAFVTLAALASYAIVLIWATRRSRPASPLASVKIVPRRS